MDLGEIGWEGLDWIQLHIDGDQLQVVVNRVTDLWVL